MHRYTLAVQVHRIAAKKKKTHMHTVHLLLLSHSQSEAEQEMSTQVRYEGSLSPNSD